MDIRVDCACGVGLAVEDCEPAYAELVIENFNRQHPHNERARKASVTTSYQYRPATAAEHVDEDGETS